MIFPHEEKNYIFAVALDASHSHLFGDPLRPHLRRYVWASVMVCFGTWIFSSDICDIYHSDLVGSKLPFTNSGCDKDDV